MESMSTENTRAPSFANNAARGLPTTSDLVKYVKIYSGTRRKSEPVDNSYDPSICFITVR
jgi:hypothetical protein